MKLPTDNLKNFMLKIIDDYSDENISSSLKLLAEDEINSVRNFVNAIDIHVSDRIQQIDNMLDRQLKKELKQAHYKKYLTGA